MKGGANPKTFVPRLRLQVSKNTSLQRAFEAFARHAELSSLDNVTFYWNGKVVDDFFEYETPHSLQMHVVEEIQYTITAPSLDRIVISDTTPQGRHADDTDSSVNGIDPNSLVASSLPPLKSTNSSGEPKPIKSLHASTHSSQSQPVSDDEGSVYGKRPLRFNDDKDKDDDDDGNDGNDGNDNQDSKGKGKDALSDEEQYEIVFLPSYYTKSTHCSCAPFAPSFGSGGTDKENEGFIFI
jgi:hypothetical protein